MAPHIPSSWICSTRNGRYMAARLCHLPTYITQNQAWYQAVGIAKVCGNVFIVIVHKHTHTHMRVICTLAWLYL